MGVKLLNDGGGMMEEKAYLDILDEIAASMREAGYDPKAQLTGYLQNGDDTYITRRDDARAKIKLVEKAQIRRYIDTL